VDATLHIFYARTQKGGHNRPIFLSLFEDDACGRYVKAKAIEDISTQERGSYGVDGTIENESERNFEPNDFS